MIYIAQPNTYKYSRKFSLVETMTRKKPFNSRKSKKEVKDLIKKWEECLKGESNRSSWKKGYIKKSRKKIAYSTKRVFGKPS